MTRSVRPVSQAVVISTFLLSLLGLGIAIYMTIAHFEGTQILACPKTHLLNCAAVTTSPQSYFLHVPVAILGLIGYFILTIINSPWGWRAASYWLHVVRFVLIVGSMAFVLWLISAELLIINHICVWCTGVHIVTFALFIVLVQVCPTQLGWTGSTTD